MVKCLCINDSDRPDEIPVELWVKKGQEYHVTHIYFLPIFGISGCELKELELTMDCCPYESYKLSRFAFNEEGMKHLIELMKKCSELNEVDINKLLEKELV